MTPAASTTTTRNGRPPVILFAGGGSGGHLSPGLAVAERLRELAPDARTLFACSERSVDAQMLDAASVEWHAIPAAGFSARPGGLLRFMREYQRGTKRATTLVRAEDVDMVVAMGGFVAAPVMRAARRCGVRTILVNLDDPPGKANRVMARHSDCVISTIAGHDQRRFAEHVVPMPIRRNCLARDTKVAARARLGLEPDRSTLFVTGASQGATSLNHLMIHLLASCPDLFDDWQVLHLSGAAMEQEVRDAYARAAVPAVVMAFCDAMGDAWGSADLALSRSGANSVAEAWANEVPSVFLPYPYHKDMHQRHNAEPMVATGGAMIVDDAVIPEQTRPTIEPVLRHLMSDDAARDEMRLQLGSSARGDGAEAIARIVLG